MSVRARAVRGLARTPARASQGDDDGLGDAAPGSERPSGPRVIVRIVDRGPGIPPAQLERVFEPFYRAGTAGAGHRGSGLGLAIARGFTQASAGSLHVESLPGQGASFVFELPLRESAGRAPRERTGATGHRRGAAARAGHVSAQEQPAAQPPPRVLVVDDEPQIVRALKVVLREAGFEAVPAETAAQALDAPPCARRSRRSSTSCCPTATASRSRARLREWSEMPILVLSALGEEEQKVRALEAGADDYITKPFGARELVARLQAALRRAAPAEQEPRVSVEGLEIDLAGRIVLRDGQPVHLTPIEFELLRVLVRNRGRLMTHRKLIAEVWGGEYVDDIQPLRTHIARLRAKIEPEGTTGPRYIVTDPGVGYRFSL